ncbi:SPOR domain-containing protein [bacterium]|nr:SPOR domain-containing protein [bacterium]
MKNINFAPSSIKNGSRRRGKLYFFIIALVFLMAFCVVYATRIIFKGGSGFLALRDRELSHINVKVNMKAPEEKEKAEIEKRFFASSEISKPHVSLGFTNGNENTQSEFSDVASYAELHKDALKEGDGNVPGAEVAKTAGIKDTESDISDISDIKEEDLSGYLIQVYSFVIKRNADTAFNRLCDLGYSPYIKEETAPISMHNVYSEILDEKTKATQLLTRIKGIGYDPVLISLPDGRFTVRIASCYYSESAKKIVREIGRLGYNTRRLKEITQTRIYSVLLGGFEDLRAGKSMCNDLIEKGFNTPFLRQMTLAYPS